MLITARVFTATLLLFATTTGCAAARKAYDDRIGWLIAGKPPTIRFACKKKPLTGAVDWAGQDPIPLFVPGLVHSSARLAGDLVRWRMGDGTALAVTVEGPPPDEVLAKDVADVLLRSGFLLVGGPAAGVLTLSAVMTGVSIDSIPTDLLGLEGKTHAAVDFAVKVSNGDLSKAIPFKGEHVFTALSALASAPETTVTEAYCAGLQTFADAVALPSFVRGMRDIVAAADRVASAPEPESLVPAP